MAADTSLPRSYKFFYVKRTPDGFLHAAQQINKNTTFPGYNPIEGDWCLVVAPTGICVNGDYGTNPPLEEMREMADLMREAVEAFDHVSGESEIARLRADVDAANARAAAAERERDAAARFYVYRHDSYEPGDLEYWNAFETIDEAKREIEKGLKCQDMGIYVCRNNELSGLLTYEAVWNAAYTEYVYEWKPLTAQPADGSAAE